MLKEITISETEYQNLKDNNFTEFSLKFSSILAGIIGTLVILWKINSYFNEIKNDVNYLKEGFNKYFKKVDNINAFLIRKFNDYRHIDDDE